MSTTMPNLPAPVAGARETSQAGPFRPARASTATAVWALRLSAGGMLLATVLTVYRLVLLARLGSLGPVEFEDTAVSHDAVAGVAGTLVAGSFVVLGIAGIATVAWTRRSYRNLTALGLGETRFRKGWAVGAWFVPFLSLVRPKQIVDEIWRGSEAAALGDTRCWRSRVVHGQLHAWWGLGIAAGVFLRIAGAMAETMPSTLDEMVSSLQVEAVLLTLGLGAFAATAVLAARIVRQVTRWQADAVSHAPA